MDGRRFIQWEYIIFYTDWDWAPIQTQQRPLQTQKLSSPSHSINYLLVWIIVPVLIYKRLNIQKTICIAQLFSWSDWGSRLSRVQVSIESLTMHHYYWTQVPLIPWYVTMIYKKDFSGLFNNRTARLFVFYQCSIRFFLTKIFLNFTLFTFFHNLIFTDRRKFIMWEPIFLGQSFFTSFPISLTTFSSSSCNCEQQQKN